MNEYDKILRRLAKVLKNGIEANLRDGRDFNEVASEARKVVQRYNIGDELAKRFQADADLILKKLLTEAKELYSFVEDIDVKLARSKDSLRNLAETTQILKEFARIQNQIINDSVQIIKEGFFQNLSTEEIIERLQDSLNLDKARWRAVTIANTGLSGYSNTINTKLATDLGVQKFRHAGQKPERAVCREWHGKTFTIDEIKQLDNKQGLPVLTYVGGWNCTHFWEPVIDQELIKKQGQNNE